MATVAELETRLGDLEKKVAEIDDAVAELEASSSSDLPSAGPSEPFGYVPNVLPEQDEPKDEPDNVTSLPPVSNDG